MIKTNLPVIVLKGIIILPYSELKLEINNAIDLKIINLSKDKHQGHVILASPEKYLEEKLELKDLPKIGVVAKISKIIEVPNGNNKIIFEAINRSSIYDYKLYDDSSKILEAIIGPTAVYAIEKRDEEALIRKLSYELENLISLVPYVSNSILSKIKDIDSISKFADIITDFLPIDFVRKLVYLNTINPHTRVMMLLEDIQKELDIFEIEKKIDGELKKSLDKSQKEFILKEKIRIIKEELGEISTKDEELEIIKNKLSKIKAPKNIKEKLEKEIKKYDSTPSNSPELAMIRNYIDLMLSLPWSAKTKDNTNLKDIKKVLDSTHKGLDEIKDRIIEFIAVKQCSTSNKAPIICLVGPPGVGKTSLAKSIAKSLNRKFVKISVGGVNDVAEIVGHRRTYMGANPGRIINAINKSKVINPVFLIDEIDKMTRDIKGDPASSLLEVLDREQNSTFFDNYVDEPYDLSNVMFILTANYIYQIPHALKDRLEIIDISSYTEYEKLHIAKEHLVNIAINEYNIESINIEFSDDMLLYIIRNYTKEAGVRKLDQVIRQIIRKIVKEHLENNIKKIDVTITNKLIIKYLGKQKVSYIKNMNQTTPGIVNGLAYTNFGGDILPLEVITYPGKGDLILTGSLGEVMRESANIALGFIKSRAKEYDIDFKKFGELNIHINAVEGGIKKEGPSAGIALTTALISAFKNKPVSKTVALTGEISLSGIVFSIGGLKEKLIGASRAGIKTVFIPKDNKDDIDEIPKDITKQLKIKYIDNYGEIYDHLFKEKKK